MDCTVPGERLPEVQCRPETLNVTVMDQFYKHVLLHFSPHNEFCWFSFSFFLFFLSKGKRSVLGEKS